MQVVGGQFGLDQLARRMRNDASIAELDRGVLSASRIAEQLGLKVHDVYNCRVRRRKAGEVLDERVSRNGRKKG